MLGFTGKRSSSSFNCGVGFHHVLAAPLASKRQSENKIETNQTPKKHTDLDIRDLLPIEEFHLDVGLLVRQLRQSAATAATWPATIATRA
jgi:hypothetical protein